MTSRTRWQTLVTIALVTGVLTWWVLERLTSQGTVLPEVSWLVGPVELLIAAVVLSMGWAVRQYLRGKRPSLDPIRAARTAVLAKAACYTGALLVGWYGGQLVLRVSSLDIEINAARAWAAGAATLGALVLLVVGLVVEHMCRVPPAEPEQDVRGTHA
ncbi:DUF3180 domain-containing protein [Cellulomonas sp. HZM]|uniref:DUF3180 domain-containing protein n=1 Tax=Cellulomonas sp. HZM TaxID=1454010 RepID=UPI0004938B55|nr:DUF3180 domain-containing protein [Cellulomonas sp. HZM]